MNDKELFVLIRKGDERAFTILYKSYYRPLCAYIRTYTSDLNSSEEIVQSTFVALWQKRERIQIHTSLKSYLYKTAYNEFLQTRRDAGKTEKLIEDLKHQAIMEELEEEQQEVDSRVARVQSIIEKLPPRCKEVVLLRQQGLKYQEIATDLGLSVKSVETQLRIAFKKIKKDFEDKEMVLSIFFLPYMEERCDGSLQKYGHR